MLATAMWVAMRCYSGYPGESDPFAEKDAELEMDESHFGTSRKGGGRRSLRYKHGEKYKTAAIGIGVRELAGRIYY